MIWFCFRGSTPFFRGESLHEASEVLVPDDDGPPQRTIDGGLITRGP